MAELTNELDDLESLLLSPGWNRVLEKLEREWGRTGRRYLDQLERMANATADQRAEAAENMTRLIWVRKELETFFSSILADVQRLKAAKTPSESGQSRRGLL